MGIVDISDPRLAEARARVAALDGELQAAQRTIADLTLALESNRDIGAAIGIVMITRAVDAEAAFDLLRRASQSRHVKLRDVAREVVQVRELQLELPAASLPTEPPQERPRPVPAPPHRVRERQPG